MSWLVPGDRAGSGTPLACDHAVVQGRQRADPMGARLVALHHALCAGSTHLTSHNGRSERLSVGWCHLCTTHIWPTCVGSRNWRCVHDRRSARVEEWCDQREHFAGPLHHADVRGPGEHCELRVRQEFEHLHHVGQR